MNFVIGNKVASKTPTNKFAVEIKLMHGDADLYTNETVLIDAASEYKFVYLKELVNLLAELNRLPSGYSERYNSIDTFNKWFNDGASPNISDEEYKVFSSVVKTFDWSGDKTCDGCRPASLDEYRIYFYNEAGDKFVVRATN